MHFGCFEVLSGDIDLVMHFSREHLTLYLPHYEQTLGESAFYVFLKVNSPNNDIEKEFLENFISMLRYELFPKWQHS